MLSSTVLICMFLLANISSYNELMGNVLLKVNNRWSRWTGPGLELQ